MKGDTKPAFNFYGDPMSEATIDILTQALDTMSLNPDYISYTSSKNYMQIDVGNITYMFDQMPKSADELIQAFHCHNKTLELHNWRERWLLDNKPDPILFDEILLIQLSRLGVSADAFEQAMDIMAKRPIHTVQDKGVIERSERDVWIDDQCYDTVEEGIVATAITHKNLILYGRMIFLKEEIFLPESLQQTAVGMPLDRILSGTIYDGKRLIISDISPRSIEVEPNIISKEKFMSEMRAHEAARL